MYASLTTTEARNARQAGTGGCRQILMNEKFNDALRQLYGAKCRDLKPRSEQLRQLDRVRPIPVYAKMDGENEEETGTKGNELARSCEPFGRCEKVLTTNTPATSQALDTTNLL